MSFYVAVSTLMESKSRSHVAESLQRNYYLKALAHKRKS